MDRTALDRAFLFTLARGINQCADDLVRIFRLKWSGASSSKMYSTFFVDGRCAEICAAKIKGANEAERRRSDWIAHQLSLAALPPHVEKVCGSSRR
jgi:hypothetical protein